MEKFSTLSDLRLYELCKTYGRNALFWRQKFIGLLPEVNRRKLYGKYGFSSIFEFASKLAGVSNEQVKRALSLENKFQDKKDLHKLLTTGKASINKLAKIASIATVENQEFLAKQVKILPCRTLETLARDERLQVKFVHVNKSKNQPEQSDLQLSEEVKQRLLELQRKGIDINQLLTKFLNKREADLKEKKDNIAEELKANKKDGSENSRHIPAKVKKIIQEEHSTKCAVPNCNKPSEHLHHALPFALTQNHDPHYLIPLCKDHHIIAHSINQQFQEMRQVAVT